MLILRSSVGASLLSMLVAAGCGSEANTSDAGPASSSTSVGGGGGTSAAGGAGGTSAAGGAAGGGGGSGAVVDTGLPGFGGAPPAIGTGDLFCEGDFVTNNVHQVARYDGVAEQLSLLSLAGLDGTDVSSIELSPDGATLLVSGRDVTTTSELLYAYDAATFAPLSTLFDANGLAPHAVNINGMTYSPDGTRIAFVADIDSNNDFALYVISSQGGASPLRVSQSVPANGDVQAYAWVDNATLAYVADVTLDNAMSIWAVDVTATNPVPIPLLPTAGLTPTRDVYHRYVQVDAQGRVYFRSSHEVEGGCASIG